MACGSSTELRLVLCNTKHEVEVAEVEEVTWVSSAHQTCVSREHYGRSEV